MDPVYEGGPWTRSKEGVHGPGVHVLSSPYRNNLRRNSKPRYGNRHEMFIALVLHLVF